MFGGGFARVEEKKTKDTYSIIHMNLPLESLSIKKNRIKIRCVVLKI